MTTAQRAVVALAFVVAVAGGALLAFNLLGRGSGPGASASPIALASPAATTAESAAPGASSSAPSSAPASVEPSSVAPSASAGASASPSASPTNAPGEPTTVVVTALKLDAGDDPDGVNRRLSFRTQGSGDIVVSVKTLSPQGSAVLCLSAGTQKLGCKTTANGKLTAHTNTRRADFLATLRGDGIETPVVEVTLTFPARKPSLTIENGRFDGTQYPDTNGLQAFITPRADGDVTLEASWGGHPFDYEVDLLEQGGPGTQVLANQGPSTGAQATLPVTVGNPWKLVLQNIDDGFGITLLDATISWP